jgi:hypothetical protein
MEQELNPNYVPEVKEEEADPAQERELKMHINLADRKKKIIGGILGVLILTVIVFWYIKIQSDPLIFQKEEKYGPCLTKEPGCYQLIKLFNSGKIVSEGKDMYNRTLSKDRLTDFKEVINDTGILTKDCEETNEAQVAYSVNYMFNLDNKKKIIEYPGCIDEINQLENFIK